MDSAFAGLARASAGGRLHLLGVVTAVRSPAGWLPKGCRVPAREGIPPHRTRPSARARPRRTGGPPASAAAATGRRRAGRAWPPRKAERPARRGENWAERAWRRPKKSRPIPRARGLSGAAATAAARGIQPREKEHEPQGGVERLRRVVDQHRVECIEGAPRRPPTLSQTTSWRARPRAPPRFPWRTAPIASAAGKSPPALTPANLRPARRSAYPGAR